MPVAPFASIQSLHDLEEAVAITNFPAVLKTCRGGYDGKGQKVVHTWDELTEAAENLLTYGELVLEAFVPFTCEVSVIATKSLMVRLRFSSSGKRTPRQYFASYDCASSC